MATNRWKNRTGTDVAQVWAGTITTTTSTHTYIVTLTDDLGNTGAITYTVTGSEGSVTAVALGFLTAWNASTHPLVSQLTASQNAGQVILTADTAGVPFSAAATGSGTWSGTGNTTSNSGVNDWNTAANWSLNAVPVATDDVVVAGPTNTGACTAIKYGLNQTSVALGNVYFQEDYNGQIGREEHGYQYYLRIDPDGFDYQAASNLAFIDLHSAAIAPQIKCNGNPVSGKYALHLKGSAMTTLEVRKGKVGVAALPGETATAATVLCSFVSNLQSDVDLTLGSGVTLTTLTQSGGKCIQRCASTTSSNALNTFLTTEGSGAITTLNVYGTTYPNSSGTVTTMNLYGWCDETRDRTARTISTTVVKPGSKLTRVAAVTHTTVTLPTDPGVFTYEVVG